ncbi:unnamed protein product [Durusdinium trenchii]
MYGVGACITVSLAPPTPPKPITSDEEATDVPSDEGSEEIEEEDEEETDLPGTVEDEVAKMEKEPDTPKIEPEPETPETPNFEEEEEEEEAAATASRWR